MVSGRVFLMVSEGVSAKVSGMVSTMVSAMISGGSTMVSTKVSEGFSVVTGVIIFLTLGFLRIGVKVSPIMV